MTHEEVRHEQDNKPPSIADGPAQLVARRVFWWTLLAAALVCTIAAVVYAREGLTLSHYDARAHLVVARRIVDSLTPGWRQIGAVWLPLPHLLNLLPAQLDWNYRTGFLSVGISIAALSLGLAAIASYVYRRTGALWPALVAPALVLSSPDVLYLVSTPMTEPLLFGVAMLALVSVDRWIRVPDTARLMRAVWAVGALMLTRYEGWAITGALFVVIVLSMTRRHYVGTAALIGTAMAAVAGFVFMSWWATGIWFVSDGFFTPDNPVRHNLPATLALVLTSTRELGGDLLVAAGIAGAASCLVAAWRDRAALLPGVLLAAAALPTVAFYEGHPHRIRYMVPLVVACGVLAAFAVARMPKKIHAVVAVLLVAGVVIARPSFDPKAPMVVEAQWEAPFRIGRQAVSRYLEGAYDHTPILASMGSLAHYMQESSAHGMRIHDFVHEGNGDLWSGAMLTPRAHVAWILIEEQAEGGDELAKRARRDPTFLDGFARVAEGGGVALYRRVH